MTEAAAQDVTPSTSQESVQTDTRLTTSEPSSDFAIPEAYAGKGWANNIKSTDDLWREVDTLQPLIGKKSIPNSESSEEEWENFYSQLRPESTDGYDIKFPEGADETQVNQEELSQYKDLFHKAGLTPQQAQLLFDGDLAIRNSSMQQSVEQQDAEFKEMTQGVFGDKVNEAIKVSNTLLQTLPSDQAAAIQQLPNDQLVSVMTLLNNVHNKYSSEDVPMGGDQAPAKSPEEISKALLEAKTKLRETDLFSPDYKRLENEIDKLREQHRRAHNG
jgi:hypothetical protein